MSTPIVHTLNNSTHSIATAIEKQLSKPGLSLNLPRDATQFAQKAPPVTDISAKDKAVAAGWSWKSKALMGAGGAVALVGGRLVMRRLGYNMLHVPYMDEALDRAVESGIPYVKSLYQQAGPMYASASKQVSASYSSLLEKLNGLNPFRMEQVIKPEPLIPLDCSGKFGADIKGLKKFQNIIGEKAISHSCPELREIFQKNNISMTPENKLAFLQGNFGDIKKKLLQLHPDKKLGKASTFQELKEAADDLKNLVFKPNFRGLSDKITPIAAHDVVGDALQARHSFIRESLDALTKEKIRLKEKLNLVKGNFGFRYDWDPFYRKSINGQMEQLSKQIAKTGEMIEPYKVLRDAQVSTIKQHF